MANVKDLNRKIVSLQNMQKVTRAMNLIASTRLHKLFPIQIPLARFDAANEKIAANMRDQLDKSAHPALGGYQETKRIHLVLFTSDKGLCGAHNHSVHRELASFVEKNRQKGIETDLTCFGSKGVNFSRRRGYQIADAGVISERSMGPDRLRNTAEKLFARFDAGEVQEVYLVFNRYISTLHQETTLRRVLPLAAPAVPGEQSETNKTDAPGEASTEPGVESFVRSASELYLCYALAVALYNSYLSEYASRMTAMENATDNSKDLIDRYVTLQNRARQADITNEIIEIVSGKEAMKG